MYLSNDVQQWWYILIYAIALPFMIGSVFHLTFCIWGHLNEDNWSLWYSIFKFCFSAYWSCSLNDDDHWPLYCVRSAIAVLSTVGIFILTLCNWYYMKDDNEQVRWHLRFAMSALSSFGPFPSAFLGWWCTTDNDQRLWWYVSLIRILLCTI